MRSARAALRAAREPRSNCGEYYLEEDLFAPFAHVRFDDGVGAGDCAVPSAPVGGQVGDRAEVRVDRELVAAGVVAGCLVLEVARRSGPVAGGDPGDVGEIDGSVGARMVLSVVCGRLAVRRVVGGLSVGGGVRRFRGRRCGARLGSGRRPADGLIAGAADGWRGGWLPWRLSWPVAAEAVERHDRADAVADRFPARDGVGGGCAFLELCELLGHRGGEVLAPARPRQGLVVEQQLRPGGVRLQAAVFELGSRWSTTRS